jgi:hypothetical protein
MREKRDVSSIQLAVDENDSKPVVFQPPAMAMQFANVTKDSQDMEVENNKEKNKTNLSKNISGGLGREESPETKSVRRAAEGTEKNNTKSGVKKNKKKATSAGSKKKPSKKSGKKNKKNKKKKSTKVSTAGSKKGKSKKSGKKKQKKGKGKKKSSSKKSKKAKSGKKEVLKGNAHFEHLCQDVDKVFL